MFDRVIDVWQGSKCCKALHFRCFRGSWLRLQTRKKSQVLRKEDALTDLLNFRERVFDQTNKLKLYY